MSIDTTLRIDENVVRQISKEQQEPQWMLDFRLKGLELASTLPLPQLEKTKIGKWNMEGAPFQQAIKITSLEQLPEDLKQLLTNDSEDRNLIVQNNATIAFHQLSAQLASQGVIFTDLATALHQHPDLVEKYFMKAVDQGENKVSALHSAIWSGGVFLYVPKNTQVELPVQALFWISEGDVAVAPHVIVVAEANSTVTYVDNYISYSQTAPSVHNGVVEVYVQSGAQVRFVTVHDFAKDTTDFTYRRAVVENDAKLEWVIGEMNNGNTVADNTAVMKGTGSDVDITTICIASGEQKINQTSRIQHIGKHTESNIVTRSVMREQSIAIFNGITKIEKGAQKANGVQAEKILMLSEKTRGDANPILLIDEDDVKAGHAASVGRIDENQLYYLMSRGIEKKEAERLIIHGFLEPVVSKVPIEALRERLVDMIERKLS